MIPRLTRRMNLLSGKAILFVISVLLFTVLIASPPALAADNHLFDPCKIQSGTNEPTKLPADSSVCREGPKTTQNPIPAIIKSAANVFAVVSGVAAIIIIIVSGFVFTTAGGTPGGQRSGDSPSRAAKAGGTMTGALIGLVVIALAWSIVSFAVDKFIKT